MKTKTAAAIALAAMGFFSVARGQTLILTGTLENSLQSQELTEVFPNIGADDGTISSWVINDPSLDPSGDIFIYQVINSGRDTIPHIELTGFNSSDVLANGVSTYSGVTGLALAGAVTPSANGNFSNYSLTGTEALNFDGGKLPNGGGASYFLFVATNQKGYGISYAQDQSEFTAVGTILAPVPEPSASVIFLAGFACLFGVLKYRRFALKG